MDLGDVQVVFFRAADAGLESLDDFLIALKRENQGDVDGNAISQSFANSAHGAIGRRDLDHDVVTANAAPQLTSLRDGRISVARDTPIYLIRYTAIFDAAYLVILLEYITGIAHIVDSQ